MIIVILYVLYMYMYMYSGFGMVDVPDFGFPGSQQLSFRDSSNLLSFPSARAPCWMTSLGFCTD